MKVSGDISFCFVFIWIRMQVEVSKHTEGAKEKTLRPNGLPESLIRYDGIYTFIIFLFYSVIFKTFTKLIFKICFVIARQKDMATNSVTELVEAVKRPRALSESTNYHPFMTKSETDDIPAKPARRMSENIVPSGRRNSGGGRRTSMTRISEIPEKKTKSSRLSFMG